MIDEPSQTSDSQEKGTVFPDQITADKGTANGMPSSTLALIIATIPIIAALLIVVYDTVFSTNEKALQLLNWIPFAVGVIAMTLNYLLIQADVVRMKKADVPFEFNVSWIILTPVYLFKRALAIKQKIKNSSFVNTDGIAALSLLAIALAVWYPLASLSNADILSTKKSVIENYANRNIALKNVTFARNSFNTAVGWLTISPNNMIEMNAKCRVNKTPFSSQLVWECDDATNVALTKEAQQILNPNAATLLPSQAIADDLALKKPNREVTELIGNFNLFAKQCVEGNSNSPVTRKACEEMETIYSRIERLGWCPESDKVQLGTMRWVACTATTNNPTITSSETTQSRMQSTRDEWIEVYATDLGISYIDPSTIRKEGNLRTAWTIQNYKQRDKAGAISTRTTEEFDCKNKRYKFLAFTRYTEPMAKGKTVSSIERPGEWDEIPPNSAAEGVRKIACAQ